MINNKLNKNISIFLLLVLLAMSITCTFLVINNNSFAYADYFPNIVNNLVYDNFTAGYALHWQNDTGNSFSDLAHLPSTSYTKDIWIDVTDFSSYKISNNQYNFCCYIPFNNGSYNSFDSVARNGVVYDRYFYLYVNGSSGSYNGYLVQYELLKRESTWYFCVINYIDNVTTIIETASPYDDLETFKYFNFSFGSNVNRITYRSNVYISILNVGAAVNQLVYTAFQSRNPTFLITATYDGAYNAGYEDAKAKYNNLSAYMPGGVEYQKIYNLGKLAGSSETYTFFGLISAVIDAPIKAFTGLLNFEIFGVNIKSFLLSLFTIALVIAIVKLFMGNGGSNGS